MLRNHESAQAWVGARRSDGLLLWPVNADEWIIIPGDEMRALTVCAVGQQSLPVLEVARAVANACFPLRID